MQTQKRKRFPKNHVQTQKPCADPKRPCASALGSQKEEISFEASDLGSKGETINIDAAYVEKNLGELASNEDLTRFIL